MLGKGPIFGINESFGSPKEKFSINFSKANTQNCFSWHYSDYNIYFLVKGKEIFKFKANNKNVNFPTHFYFESMSNGFSATESTEVSLNENVFDFSVDYNSIGRYDILNIHKYLLTKNKVKQCSILLNKCLLYDRVLVAL